MSPEVQTPVPGVDDLETVIGLFEHPRKLDKDSGYTIFAASGEEPHFVKWYPADDRSDDIRVPLLFNNYCQPPHISERLAGAVKTPAILAVTNIKSPLSGRDLVVVESEYIDPEWDMVSEATVLSNMLRAWGAMDDMPTGWLVSLGRDVKTPTSYVEEMGNMIVYLRGANAINDENEAVLQTQLVPIGKTFSPVVTHGDFNRTNFSIKEWGVVLYDLEKMCVGNRLEDVARIVNRLMIVPEAEATYNLLTGLHSGTKDQLTAFRVLKALFIAQHNYRKYLSRNELWCKKKAEYYIGLSLKLSETGEGFKSAEACGLWDEVVKLKNNAE